MSRCNICPSPVIEIAHESAARNRAAKKVNRIEQSLIFGKRGASWLMRPLHQIIPESFEFSVCHGERPVQLGDHLSKSGTRPYGFQFENAGSVFRFTALF